MSSIKEAFEQLVKKSDRDQKVKLVAAEQVLIGFYFDVIKANVTTRITGKNSFGELDFVPVQNAVQAIGEACAALGETDLFQGDIETPSELFVFAKEIVG